MTVLGDISGIQNPPFDVADTGGGRARRVLAPLGRPCNRYGHATAVERETDTETGA
jgi:hypothetical protein